jgi:predicted dehydrogenase
VTVDGATAPFGKSNWANNERANYRMLGVADMLEAAESGREPRCSGRVALHALDVMMSILQAAAERKVVDLSTTAERPAPLTALDAERLLAKR